MLLISLLITILTQMISALINHRGSNLRWGLKTLFANVDAKRLPRLTENAEKVAEAVLTHCLVSDSWFSENRVANQLAKIPLIAQLFRRFRLATAIRPGELTAILEHLATNTFADQDKELAAEIRTLLGMPAAAAAVASAAGEQKLAQNITAAGNALAGAVESAEEAASKLQAWFASMMDRVSQKFTMYMRIWTVAFAACFAFGLALNTVSLLNSLYTDSTLRNSLVAAADQVMKSASEVLDSKNSLAARYSAALQQALKEDAITPSSPVPPNLATPDDAAQWVAQNIPEAQRADVLQRFNTLAVAASRQAIQSSYTQADTLAALAAKSGLSILDFQWPWKRSWTWPNFFGVLATVGLLSLGAPFWFNSLKSLTNLRSTVATKDSVEEAA